MANTLKKDVIIDLKVSDSEAVKNVADLDKHLAELKAEILKIQGAREMGKITEEEYYKQLAMTNAEIKLTKTSLAAYQKELQNNIINEKAEEDSIEAMRARLANMRKEYEQLGRAQRENPLVGGQQLKDIQNLTAEIKQLEQAQGDWRRNVGNYPSAFDASSESLQRFGDILGKIFGGGGIIGTAAKTVVGFGRGLADVGKNIQDTASTITNSASTMASSVGQMADGAKVVENAGQSFTDVGNAAAGATTTVQGFGKALYETGTAEETAATGATAAAKGIGGISGAFKTAGTAVKAFSKQLMALLTNPYVAAIAAIIVVVLKLVEAFKKNDAAMTALQRVFAAFKPILDVINLAFTKLADIIGKVMDGIANFVQKVTSFIPVLKDYAAAEDDVVVATDNLEEAERQYTVNHAKRETEISELNAKAADSEKYTFAERKKFMEDAAKLEKEDLAEAKKNAKEKLRITRQKAALDMGYAEFNEEVYAKLSDERKKELADLEAAVYGAEKAYNDGMRTINKRMSTFTKQEENERKQRAQSAAQAAKERKKAEEDALKALQKLWIDSIRDLRAKEYATIKSGHEQQIAELKKRLVEEKNLTKKAKEAINEQIILLEADLQIKLGELRKKWAQDDEQKQLNETKAYYERLLKNLTTDEAKIAIEIELQKIDSTALKNTLKASVDEAQTLYDEAFKAMNDKLSEKEIENRFGMVFDQKDIDTSKGYAKALEELVNRYYDDLRTAKLKYDRDAKVIDDATANAELKIRKKYSDNAIAIERKHQEILNAIQQSDDLELYHSNEVEKAKIMQRGAEQRLAIAKSEYNDLLAERDKYTDQELAQIYGSVDAYYLKLEEAHLKVVEANNKVKESMRDVSRAQDEEKKKMIAAVTSIADALNNVAANFQSLFETLAEDNESYSDFATAMAMMQILVSSAISIASAIQGATEAAAATGPAAPFTLAAYIVEMVAIVAGGIASAVSVLKKAKEAKASKPKFAEGGLVGNRTTTKKDDKIDAKLSEGEYVITAPVVKKVGVDFLDMLNFGKLMGRRRMTAFADGGAVTAIPRTAIEKTQTITTEDLRDAMRDAVMDIQPVVSVKEITTKQNRVRVKEKLATAR